MRLVSLPSTGKNIRRRPTHAHGLVPPHPPRTGVPRPLRGLPLLQRELQEAPPEPPVEHSPAPSAVRQYETEEAGVLDERTREEAHGVPLAPPSPLPGAGARRGARRGVGRRGRPGGGVGPVAERDDDAGRLAGVGPDEVGAVRGEGGRRGVGGEGAYRAVLEEREVMRRWENV